MRKTKMQRLFLYLSRELSQNSKKTIHIHDSRTNRFPFKGFQEYKKVEGSVKKYGKLLISIYAIFRPFAGKL